MRTDPPTVTTKPMIVTLVGVKPTLLRPAAIGSRNGAAFLRPLRSISGSLLAAQKVPQPYLETLSPIGGHIGIGATRRRYNRTTAGGLSPRPVAPTRTECYPI